jgi:chromosomal replication initiation ATPase DnaA
MEKVCRVYKVDESSIKSPSQNRIASEARSVLGWLARELDCATLSEVARIVNRDVSSISSAVRRLSQRMQEVPELGERVRSLKADFL